MSYQQVNQLNDNLETIRGETDQMMTAVVIPEITSDLIKRTWKWFDDIIGKEPKLDAGTFVLIKIMQKPAFHSVKSRTDTAFPHPKGRHILQLGCGALNKVCTPEMHELAVKDLGDAAREICDEYSVGDCLTRDFEEFHDSVKMFGENVPKLREIKKRVDSKGRLRGAYAF